MKKLGKRNYELLRAGVSAVGTFDPREVMGYCEEQLYVGEHGTIQQFLQWVHDNGKSFGSGNYEEVFQEFLNA